MQEKQAEISSYKCSPAGDGAKTQQLNDKIKKLKEKLAQTRAEAEEKKRIFLKKSENDDKYIEALKQELEKLKKSSLPNIKKKAQ